MHGLNGSTFSWRLLLDDLAAYTSPATGCRVLAYDRPPYGLSQRPLSWSDPLDNPYTNEAGAQLGVELLRSRGCRSVVAVGHSAGASVAVDMALRHPEMVRGLVLIAPAVNTDGKGFLARADMGQLLRLAWTQVLLRVDGPGVNYVRRQLARRRAEVEAGQLGVYHDEDDLPQEVIDGYVRPLRAHDWDRAMLEVYRSYNLTAPPPDLTKLACPVLIIQGDRDTAVPLPAAQAVAKALRARGPGHVTELLVLPRCGHSPQEEFPSRVLRAMVEFVNSHCL